MVDPSRLVRALDDVRDELIRWQTGASEAVNALGRSAADMASDLTSAHAALDLAKQNDTVTASAVADARHRAEQAWETVEEGRVAVEFRADSVQWVGTYALQTHRWWQAAVRRAAGPPPGLERALGRAGEACRAAERAAQMVASADAQRRRAKEACDQALMAGGEAARHRRGCADALDRAAWTLHEASGRSAEVDAAAMRLRRSHDRAAGLSRTGVSALADKGRALRDYDSAATLGAPR